MCVCATCDLCMSVCTCMLYGYLWGWGVRGGGGGYGGCFWEESGGMGVRHSRGCLLGENNKFFPHFAIGVKC